jgi:hypothetical protein
MGTVEAGFSRSLDGFIAGPNDEVDRVFVWMFKGDKDVQASTGDHDIDLKLTSEGVEREQMASIENLIWAQNV